AARSRAPRRCRGARAGGRPRHSPPAAGISARVSQIGLYGCYIQTASPFPAKTAVIVKIFVPGAFFECKATVAHAQEAQGMGLMFREVKPSYRIILRAWLLDAMRQDDPQAGWQCPPVFPRATELSLQPLRPKCAFTPVALVTFSIDRVPSPHYNQFSTGPAPFSLCKTSPDEEPSRALTADSHV